MKIRLFTTLLLGSLAARAQTTIEFKLTGEVHEKNSSKNLDLANINQQLKNKKLAQFPETLILGKNSHAQWAQLMSGLKVANQALKMDIELIADQGYFYEFPHICYRGKASEVPEVIDALMGSVFHEDQGIEAVRFDSVKIIHEPEAFFESNSKRLKTLKVSHPAEVKQWYQFSSRSQAVLIMSDFGTQGSDIDLTATLISRCK